MDQETKKSIDTNNKSYKSKFGWFVRNPRIAILIIIMIFFLGTMSVIRLPKESAPEIDYGIVIINTLYPGASAIDMDTLITQEIEKKIKDIDKIHKLSSTSRNSLSSIVVEFDPGTDMTKSLADVRTKIDEAKQYLPDEAEEPLIKEITSSDQPIFRLVLTGPYSPIQLRDFGENLKDHLEMSTIVNEVNISGGADREISIDVDPVKLNEYNLTFYQLRNIIKSFHADIPIGEITIDNLNYNIRYQGKYKTANDIKEIPITNTNTNSSALIHLKDIAYIYEGSKDENNISKFLISGMQESSPAIILNVFTKKRAGIFSSDSNIRQDVNSYVKQHLPKDININYTMEGIVKMTDSYNEVFKSATQTIIIVFLAILFFLGLKEALITATIVPLTFLVTFSVLKGMDSTLNFMTNFAMILSIGILVDTAIVMVEGVHNNIQKGYDSKSAAQLAIDEFSSPLISGTLTTLAVFIPLITLPGIMGKYLSFIPVTVTITLIASLLIALTITPTLSGLLLKFQAIEDKISIRRIIKGFLKKMENAYEKSIKIFIKTRFRRLFMFFMVFSLFVLTSFIPVKFEMFPPDDMQYITIFIKKPIGTTENITLASIKPIEDRLSHLPELKFYELNIKDNQATFNVELTSKDSREEKSQRTSLELQDKLSDAFSKLSDMEIKVQSLSKGPPSEFPVGFRIIAQDKEHIQKAELVTEKIKKMLQNTEGTIGVTDDIENIPGDFNLIINKDRAIYEGINPMEIPVLIRTALSGSTIVKVDRGQREIDVILRLKEKNIDNINEIKKLEILNNQGKRINIGEFVKLDIKPGLNILKRRDNKIAFTASSLLKTGYTSKEITDKMLSKLETYTPPNGITIENASENEENKDLLLALLQAFIISIILIFTILVTQFNSFRQPFLIISTIIFSQLGVNIGLYITNTYRSMAFVIGVIALSGIVVNDAIIMVDKINKTRASTKDDTDTIEIISTSAASRLQPIILTTLTTTAGILPLVFIDAFWSGLGYTIIFGLSVASFLTLFITPGMYYQLEKDFKFTIYTLIGFILIVSGIIAGFLFI